MLELMMVSASNRIGNVMSIVKRGNCKNWYIHFQFNGHTYIRSSRTTNKKIAESMEIEWKAKLHSQQYQGRKQRITLADAFEQYKLSKQGIASYRNLIAHETVLCRLLPMKKQIDELTSRDLEKFKRDRIAEGVGAESLKYGLLLIRGTLKFVQQLGYQVSDVTFPQIKLPKSSLRYLSDDEERRLLVALDPMRHGAGLPPVEKRSDEMQRALQDAYDLVISLLDTGARYSVIANIEWQRIDLASLTIRLWWQKVQNETVLYMTDRVYDVLFRRESNNTGRYVFSNRNGDARGYSAMSIRKAIKRVITEADRSSTCLLLPEEY
jgi:integrase